MALSGCYSCLKYLMFVFNFIFWLVGCSLLAVGIWAKVDESSLSGLVQNKAVVGYVAVSVAAYVIIAVGSIVTLLGFLGCCGAIRESQCMLATFFIFLFIIFSILLATGIFVYVNIKPNRAELEKAITSSLSDSVKAYNTSEEARKHLDYLRDEFICCGSVTGDMRIYGEDVCKGITRGCAPKITEKTEELLKNYLFVIVSVAFGIAVIMLLGMIFAMLLCCAIRERM